MTLRVSPLHIFWLPGANGDPFENQTLEVALRIAPLRYRRRRSWLSQGGGWEVETTTKQASLIERGDFHCLGGNLHKYAVYICIIHCRMFLDRRHEMRKDFLYLNVPLEKGHVEGPEVHFVLND